MKTINTKVFPYILSAIDPADRENNLNCDSPDRDKLQFLFDTFKSEYWHDYNKKYYKWNIQEAFKNWVMGLPSVFNIDFENYRILEIAKEWGQIPTTIDTDIPRKQYDKMVEDLEDHIIENWFNFITNKTFQLFRKHKIN